MTKHRLLEKIKIFIMDRNNSPRAINPVLVRQPPDINTPRFTAAQ